MCPDSPDGCGVEPNIWSFLNGAGAMGAIAIALAYLWNGRAERGLRLKLDDRDRIMGELNGLRTIWKMETTRLESKIGEQDRHIGDLETTVRQLQAENEDLRELLEVNGIRLPERFRHRGGVEA